MELLTLTTDLTQILSKNISFQFSTLLGRTFNFVGESLKVEKVTGENPFKRDRTFCGLTLAEKGQKEYHILALAGLDLWHATCPGHTLKLKDQEAQPFSAWAMQFSTIGDLVNGLQALGSIKAATETVTPREDESGRKYETRVFHFVQL